MLDALLSCPPGASPFLERLFGDCVYNVRDLVGFCLGLSSILCWMVAQVPQLVKNYRSQSAEALSALFLAEWLLGDTCNLLGCLLKGDQLPTAVFTAQYFIVVDAVMLIQYLYYSTLQRWRQRQGARRHRRHHHHRHSHRRQQQQQQQGREGDGGAAHGSSQSPSDGSAPEIAVHGGEAALLTLHPTAAGAAGPSDVAFRPHHAAVAAASLAAAMIVLVAHLQPAAPSALAATQRRLLSLGLDPSQLQLSKPHWAYKAGTVVGYLSSVLYLSSRVSQLLKNWQRGSVEGLALSMFACAMCANLLYGSSILIRTYSWAELRSSLPWLIGSLGTVALDTTILTQARMLGRAAKKQHHSDEEEPLLPAAASTPVMGP